jgi:two-component system, sensor histidine kinase and response regulator
VAAHPPHTTSSSPLAGQAMLAYGLPQSLPGFDIATAQKRLGGNGRLLADLLRAFATEHGNSAADIDGLLREARPATAAAVLHRVKGAARIVGAQAVAEAAQALEDDVRHGRPADITVFADVLSDAVHAIGRYVAAAPAGTPSAGTGSAYKS